MKNQDESITNILIAQEKEGNYLLRREIIIK